METDDMYIGSFLFFLNKLDIVYNFKVWRHMKTNFVYKLGKLEAVEIV